MFQASAHLTKTLVDQSVKNLFFVLRALYTIHSSPSKSEQRTDDINTRQVSVRLSLLAHLPLTLSLPRPLSSYLPALSPYSLHCPLRSYISISCLPRPLSPFFFPLHFLFAVSLIVPLRSISPFSLPYVCILFAPLSVILSRIFSASSPQCPLCG